MTTENRTIADPDAGGRLAKEKIMQFLNVLERDFTPFDIVRALEGILIDLCEEECKRDVLPGAWIRWFVPGVAENFTKFHQTILLADEIDDAMERNRKAGGDGNPYQ